MNKKTIIVSLLITLSSIVYAGGLLDIGVKFGTNNSKFSFNVEDYQEELINNFLVGAYSRVNIGRLYAQPEAYFNTKGGKFVSETISGTFNQFDFQTVDVPVLLGLKIVDKRSFNFRVYAGPLFSFITNKNRVDPDPTQTGYEGTFFDGISLDDFDDNYMGWQAGIGFDVLFFTFDARFERGSDIYLGPTNFSARSSAFILTAGISIF